MRSELHCADVRSNISARLDDELGPDDRRAIDDHLAACEECRAYAERISHVRQTVRLQPVEAVPDLTERIMAALPEDPPGVVRLRPGRLVRTAAIAAAAAFLIFIGSTVDVFDRSRDVATAAEIVRSVRAAARDLGQYRAGFEIVEHGWHRSVPTRRFETLVWFAAPERLRLEIEDVTEYPSGAWPRNDVTLVASEDRWTISEPSVCPAASLPACSAGSEREERTIIERQPFDGNSALPTDIAIPLETLSDDDSLEVISSTDAVHRVALTVQQATPLLEALQPGGSWRPFHPLDRAELWIDRETWFPLRFRVTAGQAPDRELWAERMGLPHEAPGQLLFGARATDFEEPGDIPGDVFRSRVIGAVSSGGFSAVKGSDYISVAPSYTAGLTPYRSGSADGRTLMTFVDGMTWLKVAVLPDEGLATAFSAGAEVVRVGDGEGFYLPADGRNGRRIDVYGALNVRIETNLSRRELLRVAASAPVEGAVPRTLDVPGGPTVTRLPADTAADRGPGYVPEGYELVAATSSASRGGKTLALYYRRAETSFEGNGIRVITSAGTSTLPPSSEEFVNVRVGGTLARWSFERSELEWVDGATYRAVAVPGADLGTALQIAESLT